MPFLLWRRRARDKPVHIYRQLLTHVLLALSIMRRIWCRPEAYQRPALQRIHRRGRHDRQHARRVHRQPQPVLLPPLRLVLQAFVQGKGIHSSTSEFNLSSFAQ